MAHDIPAGQEQLAVTQQVHGLIPECGEGRKPPEDADDEEGPGFPCDDPSMVRQFSQKANECAAHNIDRQGAEGKLDALAELLNVATHKVAKDRADEPACADQK